MAREKTGRNAPCPCGSGKKYKKCCIDKDHDRGGAPSARPLLGERLRDEVLGRWPMDRVRFTAGAAQMLALGRELPGCATHPWTRARIRDWFSRQGRRVPPQLTVTISEVRRETNGSLFKRLAGHAIGLDEAAFEREARAREDRSAWGLAAALIDAPIERTPDDVALAVCELWRRLVPHRPSLETLDELMQEGYEVLDPSDPRQAVERWFSFTEHLLEALPDDVGDLSAADDALPGLQSLVYWVRDAEMHLHNASLSDPDLARRGVAWCEALCARFPDDAETRMLRMEQVELHLMAGEAGAALAVAEALRAQDPHDATGYVALANVYSWSKSSELYDRARAIAVLEEALRLRVHNAVDFDVAYRLEDLRGPAS